MPTALEEGSTDGAKEAPVTAAEKLGDEAAEAVAERYPAKRRREEPDTAAAVGAAAPSGTAGAGTAVKDKDERKHEEKPVERAYKFNYERMRKKPRKWDDHEARRKWQQEYDSRMKGTNLAVIMAKRREERGWFVLTVQPGRLGLSVNVGQDGALINGIDPSCPFKDCIQVGDIIASVDGQKVTSRELLLLGHNKVRKILIIVGANLRQQKLQRVEDNAKIAATGSAVAAKVPTRKRKWPPTAAGFTSHATNGDQRKILSFPRCGQCRKCKVKNRRESGAKLGLGKKDCGKCQVCMSMSESDAKQGGEGCLMRRCPYRYSVDRIWQQITIRAPPGKMGLAFSFPNPGQVGVLKDKRGKPLPVDAQLLGQYQNTRGRPFVTYISGECPFKQRIRKGDLLLRINNKGIREPADLTHLCGEWRDLVLVGRPRPHVEKATPDVPKPDSIKPPDVWATAETAELFGFKESDDVKQLLRERIELLKLVNKTEDGYKLVAPEDPRPFHPKEIMKCRHKALFLCRAYTIALEKMDLLRFGINWVEGGKIVSREECKTMHFTWADSCNLAVKELNALGIETYETGKSVEALSKRFIQTNTLINMFGGLDYMKVIHHYPRLRELITDFAKKNKKRLSVKLIQEEIGQNILPMVWEEAKESGEDSSLEFKFLAKAAAKPPKVEVITKWIKFLGIKYDMHCLRRGKEWSEKQREGAKSYYAKPENRAKQSARMKEYFRQNPRKPPKTSGDDTPDGPNGTNDARVDEIDPNTTTTPNDQSHHELGDEDSASPDGHQSDNDDEHFDETGLAGAATDSQSEEDDNFDE